MVHLTDWNGIEGLVAMYTYPFKRVNENPFYPNPQLARKIAFITKYVVATQTKQGSNSKMQWF